MAEQDGQKLANEPAGKSVEQAASGGALSWITVLPVVLFAGLAIVFAFSLQSGDPTKLRSALIGKPAPAHDFPAVDGLTADGKVLGGVAAKDLANGQVTVVNFWASWCGPCVQEHPMLVELAKRRDIRLVGINYKDPPPGGQRFLARYGNPYVAVGGDPNGRGAIDWGVYGMPETFVVNGKGTIVFKHVGPISVIDLKEKVVPAIERALNNGVAG